MSYCSGSDSGHCRLRRQQQQRPLRLRSAVLQAPAAAGVKPTPAPAAAAAVAPAPLWQCNVSSGSRRRTHTFSGSRSSSSSYHSLHVSLTRWRRTLRSSSTSTFVCVMRRRLARRLLNTLLLTPFPSPPCLTATPYLPLFPPPNVDRTPLRLS